MKLNGIKRDEIMKKADEAKILFSSNNIRLSEREWIIVAVVCSAFLCLGPVLWGRLEKFEPGSDYRLPYELGNDYWLYSRYCRWACSKYDTLVVGDSVVWGHYVSSDNTLSHYLNLNAGRERFANLGVDGFHPAALGGLLRYYGRDISGKKVIIQFNPLWMTSAKHDLQTQKEFHFNHPKLVPQFFPKIPCYKDSFAERFSAAVQRNIPFFGWTSHLKIVYFENMDMPNWTLENPYKNPMSAISLELPAPNDDLQENISWTEKGITQVDFQWVEPSQSLQWRFFRRTIELLKARKNIVFVVVGPFNEHMLKPDSYKTYQKMKSEIQTWLQYNNIAYCVPEVLPSELYRDASHPLGPGYAMLAKQLFENQSFKSTILKVGDD
jgi:hypothetical protein